MHKIYISHFQNANMRNRFFYFRYVILFISICESNRAEKSKKNLYSIFDCESASLGESCRVNQEETMKRFLSIFKKKNCNIIGMIHIDALPGTPNYSGNYHEIIEKAKYEANVYVKHKLDSILIENMHDLPYVQHKHLGPETVACMTRISTEIRQSIRNDIPCGVQVLACGNKQALAIAKASNLQYIRAEGFVFGHIADEGYTNACAGELLRYRRSIDAIDVLIFTDLKKKHSSHAITADTSLLETAQAAELFLTDGIIITGSSTGHAANPDDLHQLCTKMNVPLLVGSGVTATNIDDYSSKAQALIVGSFFKINGLWSNELCEKRVSTLMDKIEENRLKVKN